MAKKRAKASKSKPKFGTREWDQKLGKGETPKRKKVQRRKG